MGWCCCPPVIDHFDDFDTDHISFCYWLYRQIVPSGTIRRANSSDVPASSIYNFPAYTNSGATNYERLLRQHYIKPNSNLQIFIEGEFVNQLHSSAAHIRELRLFNVFRFWEKPNSIAGGSRYVAERCTASGFVEQIDSPSIGNSANLTLGMKLKLHYSATPQYSLEYYSNGTLLTGWKVSFGGTPVNPATPQNLPTSGSFNYNSLMTNKNRQYGFWESKVAGGGLDSVTLQIATF